MGLSQRDAIRLSLLGLAACFIAVFSLHCFTEWKIGRDRTEALEAMQSKYALSEAQVAAIREIEDRYHGKGGIFTIPGHKFEEDATHIHAISQHMSPEAAARFIASKLKRVEASEIR